MFESEDVILPDDFQDAQPQAEETIETPEVPVSEDWDTTDTEQTEELTTDSQEETPQIDEQPKFKVKYNKEEQEISYDDAVPLIQKGMNFEKAVERARQEARDAYIAEQGWEWNGKPVTTEAEYKQAVREQELIEKYQSQNLPDEVIQELIENRKFREQFESQKQVEQEEQKRNAEFGEFFEYYKLANGKDFVPGQDEIPSEVWQANQNGVPLKFAYMEHHNNQLKSQLQVLKKNEENTKKAPITGLSAHGSTEVAVEDDFLRGFNSI